MTTELASQAERRSRVRAKVHWHVRFFCRSIGAIESLTMNLSSGGFYCLAEAALTPGEYLTCTLKVPAHHPTDKNEMRLLECQIRVVRVETKDSDGLFGIACEIDDYRFLQ